MDNTNSNIGTFPITTTDNNDIITITTTSSGTDDIFRINITDGTSFNTHINNIHDIKNIKLTKSSNETLEVIEYDNYFEIKVIDKKTKHDKEFNKKINEYIK